MGDAKVPESPEVLAQALKDPNLPGWNETEGDVLFNGKTYWWLRADDIYLGVLPRNWNGTNGYRWLVAQGKNGDPDYEPVPLKRGVADTPEAARIAATTWYNRNRHFIRVRP